MPATPSGRSSVVSVSSTPAWCRRACRRLGQHVLGRRPASAAGASSPEQAATAAHGSRPAEAARRDGRRAEARPRRRSSMRSACHSVGRGRLGASSPARRRPERPRTPDRRRPRSAGCRARPEPSRRPVASGRSTGAPLAAAARAGAGAGPGEDQGVLALEEAVAAHAAGGAALGGVLGERGDLDRARLGAGQRGRGAGDGDDDRPSASGSTAPKNTTRCAGGRAGCRPCRRRSGPAAARRGRRSAAAGRRW